MFVLSCCGCARNACAFRNRIETVLAIFTSVSSMWFDQAASKKAVLPKAVEHLPPVPSQNRPDWESTSADKQFRSTSLNRLSVCSEQLGTGGSRPFETLSETVDRYRNPFSDARNLPRTKQESIKSLIGCSLWLWSWFKRRIEKPQHLHDNHQRISFDPVCDLNC